MCALLRRCPVYIIMSPMADGRPMVFPKFPLTLDVHNLEATTNVEMNETRESTKALTCSLFDGEHLTTIESVAEATIEWIAVAESVARRRRRRDVQMKPLSHGRR